MTKTQNVVVSATVDQNFQVNGVPVDSVKIDLNAMTISVLNQNNLIAALPIRQGAVTVEYTILV